jgi:hypothetical protein
MVNPTALHNENDRQPNPTLKTLSGLIPNSSILVERQQNAGYVLLLPNSFDKTIL